MTHSTFNFEHAEDSPGFLLWQTTIIWQRQLKKALEPYDVTHTQFVIMANVLWFEEQGQTPTQILLVRQSKLDKMTVSQSLKKLVQLGWVQRTKHKTDTRAKSVSLTEQGKIIITKLVPIIEGVDAKFFNAIDSSSQKSLVHLLGLIISKRDV